MSDKFAASMYQTYVSATLGSLVSQAAMRGVSGASGPIDFQDSLFSGLMTGTAFIAYPVACDILKKKSASFKRSIEDPKACKAPVYIKGGMLGAAIVTLTNYPLSVLQQRHRAKNGGEAPKFSPKGVAGFYIDQLGSSIGFAATMGTLAPRIPIPKNSLLAWARQHALVNISNVGAKLCAFPVHYIRHGSTLTGMVGGYLKMVPGVVITGDATNHFKGVFGFMLQ